MTPQRYPLQWPAHRPRTKNRRTGQFKRNKRAINAPDAMRRVQEELERLGGVWPVLSSNLELRLDGLPRADRAQPLDPGVCLYFTLKGEQFALACDTYTEAAQNIAALAAHLEATRAIERYGVASASDTLEAFKALPPPPRDRVVPWREIFGLRPDFPEGHDREEAEMVINRRWKIKIGEAHPDSGGSEEAAAEVNAARDAALKEIAG